MTRTTLLLAGLLLVAGCGSTDGGERVLADIEPPSWFTEPVDAASPDADPPRWTRRYERVPKPSSDVEMVYAQALDRAGWRYHDGDCAGAPRGGKIARDCWTSPGYVLAFTTTPASSADVAPTRLDVVLHRASGSVPSPSEASGARRR